MLEIVLTPQILGAPASEALGLSRFSLMVNPHLFMLAFYQSNRVSAVMSMLFYYRHIQHVWSCSFMYMCVPCYCYACLRLLPSVWEGRLYKTFAFPQICIE